MAFRHSVLSVWKPLKIADQSSLRESNGRFLSTYQILTVGIRCDNDGLEEVDSRDALLLHTKRRISCFVPLVWNSNIPGAYSDNVMLLLLLF